jgi:DNA processing protein
VIGVGAQDPARRDGPASRSRVSERDAWIALSLIRGVGPSAFAQLLHRHGSALAAWRAGPEGVHGIGRPADELEPSFARAMAQDPHAVARALEEATRRAEGRVVIELDEAYPPALLTLDPRPPTLYIAGHDAALRERAVAIVGTRRATGYGLAVATEIGQELAEAGVVVVSGLALGIDGAAHRAAVTAAAPSIAVLPSPLNRIYPHRHRALARQIVAAGGALVSDVAIGAAVGRPDFARRNRIIAGLSEAVVVVEAPDRSGALLTAAAATTIGRELYAVPGPIDAAGSRGCNRLIADHNAVIVTSRGSLLRQIGFAHRQPPPAVEALSEVEGQLLNHLLERSGSIEELVDRTGHAPAAVATALTLLEARELVNPFGGATFHPTLAARRMARVV